MLNLSFEETVENHRKMWNWIADECLNQKRIISKLEYFKHHNIPTDLTPEFQCYACDFNKNIGGCYWYCPFIWGTDNNNCLGYDSPYNKYKGLFHRYEKAAEYARQIANLPINPRCENSN